MSEETGYSGPIELVELRPFESGSFRYSNYLAIVPDEFAPRLNWEADAYQWADFASLPSPLHFGIELLAAPNLSDVGRDMIASGHGPACGMVTRLPSPSQAEWLAGSRIADEKGQPFVAYHGSAFSFDRFSLERAGQGRGCAGEVALFFSFDPWTATHSAMVMGGGWHGATDNSGVIYPAFLWAGDPWVSHLSRYSPAAMAEALGTAKAGGHDAVLFPHLNTPGERWTVAVFDPAQVRSIFDR